MTHASATNAGQLAGQQGTKLNLTGMSGADRSTALAAQAAAQAAAVRRKQS